MLGVLSHGLPLQVCGNAEYACADLIRSCPEDRSWWQRRTLAYLIAGTALATTLWYARPRAFYQVFSVSIEPQDVVLDV